VRLNLDAGELPDEPPELWALFDILNIACGGHAGDTTSMTRVVELCVSHSIAIGAHPSYPDRDHFGRRTLAIEADDLHASIVSQLRALSRIALAHGARIEYAKPHGALYHDASRDPALAVIFIDAVHTALDDRVTIIGPRGHLQSAARAAGFTYAVEGFADRRMRPDGSLVPRNEPDALITSPAAAAAQALALSNVDTICVHADTPDALEIARAVRGAITRRSSAAASSMPASNAPSSGTSSSRSSAGAELQLVDARAFVALGDRAIRFPRPRTASARALVEAVQRWPDVVDVVVARDDVAAYFARPNVEDGDFERRIADLADLGDLNEPVREVELRAIYDGADLDDVARALAITTDEVVSVHVGATYEVDTLGFAPGFAYLVGLDARLHVARRATPRARVPAGALAIAGEYTAVYPFASPGGWNLIGRVDEKMFDPTRGARLQIGDRVRFVR
jgi:5-oxoprolinase (ATP-hydrolysing) subunit A